MHMVSLDGGFRCSWEPEGWTDSEGLRTQTLQMTSLGNHTDDRHGGSHSPLPLLSIFLPCSLGGWLFCGGCVRDGLWGPQSGMSREAGSPDGKREMETQNQ